MTERLVDLGEYRLAVDVQHTGSPPVVFVSALGSPAQTWRSVLERLTVSTTLIRYDRPGCGEVSDRYSGALAETARPVSWAAEQLRALLSLLEVDEPVVLVGHSIGGNIIDAYAVRWPGDVAGLILVDSAQDLGFFLDRDQPIEVIVDGAEPGGQPIDLATSAHEARMRLPQVMPPAVVVGSAIWRTLHIPPSTPADVLRTLPASLVELDQRFQQAQLRLAERWRAHLVIAHDAGHMIQDDAPQLIAYVIDATVAAIRKDQPVVLDPAAVREAGGALRVTATSDGLRAWLANGQLGQSVNRSTQSRTA